MVAIVSVAKSGVSVGSVPAVAGLLGCRANRPASASAGIASLTQIAHRGLAAVRLPGRRGREADRRVHREVGSERPRPVRRVERVE